MPGIWDNRDWRGRINLGTGIWEFGDFEKEGFPREENLGIWEFRKGIREEGLGREFGKGNLGREIWEGNGSQRKGIWGFEKGREFGKGKELRKGIWEFGNSGVLEGN